MVRICSPNLIMGFVVYVRSLLHKFSKINKRKALEYINWIRFILYFYILLIPIIYSYKINEWLRCDGYKILNRYAQWLCIMVWLWIDSDFKWLLIRFNLLIGLDCWIVKKSRLKGSKLSFKTNPLTKKGKPNL